MQHIKHAIISAAGLGSRLGLNKPKCLVDIGGKKIIDYILELVEDIPDVRVVVGFQEQEVMDYIRKIRSDVLFVRNPDFTTTTNSYSVYLATYDLSSPFISIDGDLLISKISFSEFLEATKNKESLVGITESKTKEAVFVKLDPTGEYVVDFDTVNEQTYEWSGLAYFSDIKIYKNSRYVFEEIKKNLPLKAFVIRCYEIDTPEDLDIALQNFESLNYMPSEETECQLV